MIIGNLGGIVFYVSPNKIETFKGFKYSGQASYSEHKRHNGDTILEYTGKGADDVSFSMTLSHELGVDVEGELKKIDKYVKNGTTLRLVFGKKAYGKYRWVITKYSVSHKYTDKRGAPIVAEVSLSLKEYNR